MSGTRGSFPGENSGCSTRAPTSTLPNPAHLLLLIRNLTSFPQADFAENRSHDLKDNAGRSDGGDDQNADPGSPRSHRCQGLLDNQGQSDRNPRLGENAYAELLADLGFSPPHYGTDPGSTHEPRGSADDVGNADETQRGKQSQVQG